MIWVETPTNPLLKLADLSAIAAIARRHNLISVADNTFASPAIHRPLEHGFDIVVHSATKYLNGHSDVVAGPAVVGDNSGLAEKLGYLQNAVGGVLDPFSSFLTLRGIRTRRCGWSATARTRCSSPNGWNSSRKWSESGFPGWPRTRIISWRASKWPCPAA